MDLEDLVVLLEVLVERAGLQEAAANNHRAELAATGQVAAEVSEV